MAMNQSLPGQPRKTKMRRFWLSYDLGLQADYGPLYAWLDKMQARECGDSAATFTVDKSRERVAKELAEVVRKGRLYLIGRTAAGKTIGGFILGGRKRAPWSGFAEGAVEAAEEE
jgi:hypothetical protein